MKLKWARVSGLAGRQTEVYEKFDPSVNIIFSRNGAGKTSLLRVIHAALLNDSSSLSRIAFDTAEVAFDHPDFGEVVRKISRHDSEKGHYETIWDSEAQEPIEFFVRDDPEWTTIPEIPAHRLMHGYLPISRISEGGGLRPGIRQRSSAAPNQSRLTEAIYDQHFIQGIEDRWREFSAHALGEIRDTQQEGIAQILSSVINGDSSRPKKKSPAEVDVQAAYNMIDAFFKDQRQLRLQLGTFEQFSDRYATSEMLQNVVAQVEQIQQKIRASQEPQRRLEAIVQELFSENKEFTFTRQGISVTSRGEEIPLVSLSSGERQLLLLMLEVLRFKKHPVIIDEPELSMHVEWQHRLVDTLLALSPSVQLIMASHSPEVMANVPDSQVIEL